MHNTELLDFIPLWAVFIGSVLLILASMEIGQFLGGLERKRQKGGQKAHTGAIVAASLGLLAFMLTFTFSSVTQRYDTKKALVLEESNAIGTAFLRGDLLAEPYRSGVQSLLLEYVDSRIHAVEAHDIVTGLAEAEALQQALWTQAISLTNHYPTPVSTLFVTALNEVLDLHATRVTVGLNQRMPAIFWYALSGLTILSMMMTGYDAALEKSTRSRANVVLALAFSVVLLLIVALDRPTARISNVSQQALIDLQQNMHATLRQREAPSRQ
jgi:hypothetical protein